MFSGFTQTANQSAGARRDVFATVVSARTGIVDCRLLHFEKHELTDAESWEDRERMMLAKVLQLQG